VRKGLLKGYVVNFTHFIRLPYDITKKSEMKEAIYRGNGFISHKLTIKMIVVGYVYKSKTTILQRILP
jgi:hypothetical protein